MLKAIKKKNGTTEMTNDGTETQSIRFLEEMK